MFGKIIKDENFDLVLKSSSNFQIDSVNFVHGFENLIVNGKVSIVENSHHSCNLKNLMPTDNWIGYDESILDYNTIEGSFKAVSYALVTSIDKCYMPAIYMDLSFCARNCSSSDLLPIFLNSNDKNAFETHFNKKKLEFISSLGLKNRIYLMDGPLFSGIHTQYNFRPDPDNIFIHFVKNSASIQVIDTLGLDKYNSDLHWAMKNLRPLERSPIFLFQSDDGRTKLFSYLKVTEKHSPVRIEASFDYARIFSLEEFWNTICHQYIAGGLGANNQPRLIQIAEMYAREVLKESKVLGYLSSKNFIPTMNEMRF